jgi:hypothetical protein
MYSTASAHVLSCGVMRMLRKLTFEHFESNLASSAAMGLSVIPVESSMMAEI